jgi:hypothetical protein
MKQIFLERKWFRLIITINHYSLFLFLFLFTTSANICPERRWSKRESTGSIAKLGLLNTALNLSSCGLKLNYSFLLSSAKSSSCSLRFCFYYSCYLLLCFIDFFCWLRDGISLSSTLNLFFCLVSNPP